VGLRLNLRRELLLSTESFSHMLGLFKGTLLAGAVPDSIAKII